MRRLTLNPSRTFFSNVPPSSTSAEGFTMGRTAGNRYPRSATPQLPAIDPAKLEPIDVPTDMLMPPNREAMTWQQEKDFARVSESSFRVIPYNAIVSDFIPPRNGS